MLSWISVVMRLLNKLAVMSALLALPCLSAYAAFKPWITLTPMQQKALAPLAQQWNTLPETQQKRLLATSKRYPLLSPEQKQLFQSRLTGWSRLTPAQRNRAREKYKAFSKLPPDKREKIIRQARQKELDRMPPVAASGVAPQL